MFTGLIERQAEVHANIARTQSHRLIIKLDAPNLQTGESISVNGVCLTLLPEHEQFLSFDLSAETLAVTTLSQLNSGALVNIERAMLATARFGGHYVSGHVDTTACLAAMRACGEAVEITVNDFGMYAKPYLLPKGSITLDGVSLTINEVNENSIKIMLVPHTLSQTTFGRMTVGQRLNVEFDYLTRVVAHQLMIVGQFKSEVEQ